MRVLLQNTETKLYFINRNEWTEDPLKATDFEQVDQAAQVYHAEGLAYARIVVEPPESETRLQLSTELMKRTQAFL